MTHRLSLLILVALGGAAPGAAPPARIDYLRDIKPVLKERCYACHGSLQQKGGLRLDTVQLLRQGGDNGSILAEGELFDRLTTKVPSRRMPRDGEPLTEQQIEAIRVWIRQGTPGPTHEQPEPDPLSHWAFQKPIRPVVPAGSSPNPIDCFLEAAWARYQLQPAPPADRATLIRRVYFDLTGLPPTRDELLAALNDPSPQAYEHLVDRLLASPRYGERWGRHWMDVWRYSDWYGRRNVPDVLNSYGMIWRWRDWIVRSLNEDKPYDRMVQEMLAADELAPGDRENGVATGFLVRNFYRWNYNNWMRDNVEHTGKAFLGLTLQCAHCHDHKYDPITQVEYFRFRAFFEPLEIRHDRWPGEPDPGVYPKYSYGASYAPIQSGLVRVFDEKLNAETWMYSKGDERDRVPGKPPMKPGAPAFLRGDKLKITPVALPPQVHSPGLQAFVLEEEQQKRRATIEAKRRERQTARAKVDQLEKQLADVASLNQRQHELRKARAAEMISTAELAAAEAEWLALQARIDAEKIKHGLQPGDRVQSAKAAAKAERLASWHQAVATLTQLEQNLLVQQTATPPDPQVANTIKAIQAQRAVVDKAREAAANPGETYTPLGPSYPTQSTGRRLALARWITSSDNPLTARVAVNHIWNWHFGQPLVETTANFGRQGSPPTHPELLDWLAVEFMEQGWRMKHLHRLIVLSRAYQMASTHPEDQANRQRDPDNKKLWKYPLRRLEAEAVRDSLLHAAGELDLRLGGPDIPHEQGLTNPRRSLYFTHHGETRMAFLELFDAANPLDCYRRTESIRPQQALALVNSELVPLMARKLAGRLAALDEPTFLQTSFETILSRPPTIAELRASQKYLFEQIELFRGKKLLPVENGPSVDPAQRAREHLLTALFNHTDFVTLR